MTEEGEGEVTVRPRAPWRVVVPVAVAVCAIAVIVYVVTTRGAQRRRTAAVRQILAVVDHDYQKCLLGEPAPDAELGRRIAVAGLTGQLTYSRAYACGELMRQALEPLRPLRDADRDLGVFWIDPPSQDAPPDFLLCEHIESVRSAARDLGVAAPPPDCATHFEPLVARIDGGAEQERPFVVGDELVEDVQNDSGERATHVVRRTRDGTSWETSAPLHTFQPLQVTGDGIFGFASVNDVVRYHVLEGEGWHAGARPADGGLPLLARRTASGWTLLDDWDDTASVIRLDDNMDHVLEDVPIRALHGRWTWDVSRLGMIDDEGNVVAFLVATKDKHVVFEAHRLPAGGKPEPPIVMTFDDGRSDQVEARRCRTASATFVAIPGIAVLVTTDGGKSFKVLPGGDKVEISHWECSDGHVFAAGAHRFSTCDAERCLSAPLPVMQGQQFRLDVSMHGAIAQVLIAYLDYAVLLQGDASSAKLAVANAWTWRDYEVLRPRIVLDHTWFILPLDRTSGI